ncbi:DUF1622 domain-containing protein [Phycisphaera mikurensis]|uniref:DUF1622 domain-containing protein n=1 Tax=Phycisphaera mikurensis (strain NBRC 102666 / KCTC 22515 / FYK2301M01) TaxID=1142394 RepID=I0IF54_PHYMF|nr:DUF1622 domain-containing protein [Phycisphaera mikurensis]MBB6440712.1 putative membrane protein [Phycisphaera mikurensis]BAM03892.1 hypothetical protein PSMK_17330 [Phycisphaera mikurensis NBRC 102666]
MPPIPLLALAKPHWFVAGAEACATAIEGIGILIILFGGLFCLGRYALGRLRGDGEDAGYARLRERLGRAILLGLEFLVAADIVATVLIDPTLESAAALGLIVVIRTFLSWSLEVELEGRWPWQGRAHAADPAGRSDPSTVRDAQE